MLLKNFHPRSQLVTKTTLMKGPRFPVVDAHNQLAEPFGGGWDRKPLPELLDLLDEAGNTHYVDKVKVLQMSFASNGWPYENPARGVLYLPGLRANKEPEGSVLMLLEYPILFR